MKNSQKGFIAAIALALTILVTIGILYYVGQEKTVDRFVVANASTAIDEFEIEYSVPTTDPSATVDRMKVNIFVPKDNVQYLSAMENFTVKGGKNPADTTIFTNEEIEVPYSADKIWASANAAARMYTRSENSPYVAYLKIVDQTAYIVLTLDLDINEGGPAAINQARPVVAKTLLQFAEIKDVRFGMAPEDAQNIQELIIR